MKYITSTLLLFCFAISALMGQSSPEIEKLAFAHVADNADSWGLTQEDVANLELTDIYQSSASGAWHVYMRQNVNGLPVVNGLINVTVNQHNKVVATGNKLVSNLKDKVMAFKPQIVPETAIQIIADDKEVYTRLDYKLLEQKSAHSFVYHKNALANSDIPVTLVYVEKDGQLLLSWDVTVDMKDNADYWNIHVDAIHGNIVKEHNYTVYCQFDHPHHKDNSCAGHAHRANTRALAGYAAAVSNSDGAKYRVIPVPAESPIHGEHTLIDSPADSVASPYGWHDTNGADGPEYTITRGNNVHAYEDSAQNDGSLGGEPDGGAELLFDFTLDPDSEPIFSDDAALTNLFYMNNIMHDFTYHLGFDESAGNFQQNSYGRGGNGNDHVNAEGFDGSGTDNANFSTPGDGNNGRMQMFLWGNTASLVNVTAPQQIEGPYEVATIADDGTWGSFVADFNVESGSIVMGRDNSTQNPTQCCNDITNFVDGQVVLIDRGICEFGTKALNAQRAGAIAAIICNVPGAGGADSDGNELVQMAAGADGGNVTIPAVFMGYDNCNRIRAALTSGNPVNISIKQEEDSGPTQLDANFDNGVIAHEYGHGISTRITGGPGNSGCLGGDEQMGEGWSDYFTLITSLTDENTGDQARGIGTYVNAETVNGRGIRPFPYSTDMTKNPVTYDDIKTLSVPHGVGSVWCSILWDLLWALVDIHGLDATWQDENSGNVRAARLVMEGLRIQPCNPGFIDGRESILVADDLLHDGEHNCLIWEVFARRGVGYFADQGTANDNADGSEDFEPLPTCIKELKIRRNITGFVNAGDEMEVTLNVTNHREDMVGAVIVTEEIEDKLSYVEGSMAVEVLANGGTFDVNVVDMGNMINFEIGDMASLDDIRITYRLQTDPDYKSTSLTYSDFENNADGFDISIEDAEGFNLWDLVSFDSNSGERSYYVAEENGSTNQVLIYSGLEVLGDFPVLRFWQKFDTRDAVNGGFLEISTDGIIWLNAGDSYLRNGPNNPIDYSTFAVPSLVGFSGLSDGWIDTYLDLRDYAGQTISVRWRFGTQEVDVSLDTPAPGWFVDDVELLDLVTYNTNTCLNANGLDQVCTVMEQTVVNSEVVSSTEDLSEVGYGLSLFPNPAKDYVTIGINSENVGDNLMLSLRSIDGKVMHNQQVTINSAQSFITLATNTFPAGFYTVNLQLGNRVMTQKLILE